MKRIQLVIVLFYLHSAAASFFENGLVQTLQDGIADGIVSDSCEAALQLYVENLQSSSDQWAFNMLDATSKIPVGLQSFNLGEMGQFSQCLGTESEDGSIQAKYCLGTLLSTTGSSGSGVASRNFVQRAHQIRSLSRRVIGLRDATDDSNSTASLFQSGIPWAICLPRNCSNEDVGEIYNRIFGTQGVTCQTKDDLTPPLTNGAIATIVILAFLAFLLVVSTALDIYFQHNKKRVPHVGFIAFSAYTNGRKLFQISKNSNELTCLNGIRFWSMMWVIIGHTFSTMVSAPVLNFKDIFEWVNSLRSMTIASGTLAVDSFFTMGGVLLVYTYLKARHNGTKFNIFQFYIHRYLRLTPALAALVLVTANLVQYMGTGPLWYNIPVSLAEPCREYWWTTLLYVQNYVNKNSSMCLGHSWYLSVDMQLYFISPLILIPLYKYSKVGIGIILSGIIASVITPFCIAYVTGIPPLMTNVVAPVSLMDYMSYYYLKTHARAAPWFIGLLLGYILSKIKFENNLRHFKFNKVVAILSWAVCLAVISTCVFARSDALMSPNYSKWESSSYIAFVRPVWAICLSFVIFACVTGNGGPIDWFLSWPIYQVLNRFTYSVYLLHYTLLIILAYSNKSGIYFNELNASYSFWGITMFSFAASVPWVLTFESPIVVLEKIIFGAPKKPEKSIADVNSPASGSGIDTLPQEVEERKYGVPE
ncbi:hypothetical protein NQ315_011234 [Exocentrus adspersus]|uniref:Nose resistant-to-fluoxetine protein N-terminal domain-containing protein n=1 Tax=Exocentrus adspersus TaxID=1586481 RepID=A0AAV8V5K5_9CUCU|nr:hypothetical protein NQ315_011234 [Exocentrus adspersus]